MNWVCFATIKRKANKNHAVQTLCNVEKCAQQSIDRCADYLKTTKLRNGIYLALSMLRRMLCCQSQPNTEGRELNPGFDLKGM